MSDDNPSFTANDIEIVRKEPLYQGFFKMQKYYFRHRLFAGGWSDVIEREIFERGHAIAVLPYDPQREEFVFLEQLRIGALETSERPWLLEMVAGIIDEGETKERVCHREAQEEAGIDITHLTKVLSYLASPGGTTERLHIFIAQTDAATAHGIHGLDYEGEDIRVHRVSEQQAWQWLNDGTIDNAATVIALQWFFLHKQTLLAGWSTGD